MSNTFDKLSVLDSFIEEVESYLPEIEANLERLAQSPNDMHALEETHRRAHTIGGSASMMDFPALAHVAHGMEDILADALEGVIILDEATIALLQRSLGRTHTLVKGIRGGVDQNSIIAQDDEDYAHYRAQSGAVPQPENSDAESNEYTEPLQQDIDMSPPLPPMQAGMPSFDEVLASFRTSTTSSIEEDVAWPEEVVSPSLSAQFAPDTVSLPLLDAPLEESISEYVQPSASALDILAASTMHMRAQSPLSPTETPQDPMESQAYDPVPVVYQSIAQETETASLPQVYMRVQQDARTLDVQVSSLKMALTQLRSAMSLIEVQHGEFKGFLDGSEDALGRLEDWAGQAMGLNLRSSPEQVRQYLPLSVMWVASSKLKEVLDLLNQITAGVEITDAHLHEVLQQLHLSIAACGESFKQLQTDSAHLPAQERGWTAWQMQEDAVRERVTFERYGDITSLRAELEAKLREELRREYEARPIPTAARAELEQQIRDEVRQEFEAKQHMQDNLSAVTESHQELEDRLRSESEIRVRQEFLNQITNIGSIASALQMMHPQPRNALPPTNFVERTTARLTQRDTPAQPSKPVDSISPAPMSLSIQSQPSAVSSATPSSPLVEFGDEAAEIFRLEAEEHLQTISMHIAALEKAPADRDLIQGVRRAIHTLKGAAGMMGLRTIADLCHVSEDLLDGVMEGSTPISPAVLSIILDTAETLDMLITGKGIGQDSPEARTEALRARYVELLGEQTTTPHTLDEDVDAVEGSMTQPPLVADVLGAGQATEARPQGDLSVRVRLQKLDELVNLFGEMLVNRSVLEERMSRLARLVADVALSSNRLYDVGQKLESRFEAATLPSGRSVQVMPGESKQIIDSHNGKSSAEPEYLAEFDELELDRYTEFHQLARGLSEGISDMTTLSSEMDTVIRECEGVFARENRLGTTFQDRLLKIRLVPLAAMTPRLYRAARAVAFKQHKEFELLLEGETTEVDRTVYEEVAGPLLHLMRNAVNHAIEAPDVRIQKGKPAAGKITLSACYEGNMVVITVRDDGTGIDPEHVRSAALARGLIRPSQILSESDLIELIFRPGFSTAEFVSEESGRGVGLDVVRDSVARLRGTLVVDSTPGQGTAFTMKFPTSLAIQSVMMVVVGTQQYAIPTVIVESVGRLDNFKRSTLSGQPAILVRDDPYALVILAQYLSLPTGIINDKAPILLVNAGGRRIALLVDEIKGKSDVVMKNLGPHLRHVYGIAGGTVLGNGRVVLILELSELLTVRPRLNSSVASGAGIVMRPENSTQAAVRQSIHAQRQTAVPQSVPTAPERGKCILVVDDSPSVRRVVNMMLKQRGWETQMARDGVEALEIIARGTPAAILLDIEMPRMDGYELIATLRAQEQYRTLPLIVLTSRAASKHQQRAMQLGANAYMVKPYQDEELINTINSFVYGTVTR
ncbi:MAG: Hpt domain-containing protein [Ktedonobacteraceae bacterium]|nr:Hpt domain-containing protein [Ktedonobacteraceae bacterium]